MQARKISEYLLHGAENALTAAELSRITGLDKRQVSQAVEYERRHGAAICADCGASSGYYLADSREEFAEYVRRLSRRCREIDETRRSCMKTLRNFDTGEARKG